MPHNLITCENIKSLGKDHIIPNYDAEFEKKGIPPHRIKEDFLYRFNKYLEPEQGNFSGFLLSDEGAVSHDLFQRLHSSDSFNTYRINDLTGKLLAEAAVNKKRVDILYELVMKYKVNPCLETLKDAARKFPRNSMQQLLDHLKLDWEQLTDKLTTTTKPTTTPDPATPGCFSVDSSNPNSTMSNEELLNWASSLEDGDPKKLEAIDAIVRKNLTIEAAKFGIQIHNLAQAPVNQTTIIDWMKNRAHSLVNNASPLITHGMHYLTAITTSGALCVTPWLQNQTRQALHGESTDGPNPNLLAGIIAGSIVGCGVVFVGGAYAIYSKYQQHKKYQACLNNEPVENPEKIPMNTV